MWATLKRDWRAILVQSVLTTALFIGAIWGLSILMGASARNERVDTATARIVQEVRSVRTLLCGALSQAENPALVQAVKENCNGESS